MDVTEQQQTIIDHGRGAMMVLAGAGSGKTTTISARGAALVSRRDCEPDQHLMLTFSRKASQEMRMRCLTFLREGGNAVRASSLPIETYHAFGYRLLREAPEIAGRRPGVTLQDDADRKRMVKSICAAMDLDFAKNRSRFEAWYGTYSLAKNYGLCASDQGNMDSLRKIFASSSTIRSSDAPLALRFASEYERRLRMTNTFDFDDLCLWAARGLRDNPDLARDYSERYPLITIDEAQDTNLVQYEMVNAIARHHGNLTLVGDDDQSIYGWRGARQENMTRFERDYKPVTARLERNFRSTPAIVAAAAAHIRHNIGRKEKSPFAEGAQGDRPAVAAYLNGWDMADGIADQIAQSIGRGVEPRDIAVLYRTNRMARLVEGGLRARGIPYHIVGGHSLYDATEVKVAIAGARLMINGGDEQALRQLLPHIPGLGGKGLERLLDVAEDDTSGRLDVFGAAAKMGGRYLEYFTWLDSRLSVLRAWGPCRAGEWVLADEGLGYARRLNDRAHSSDSAADEAKRRAANLTALDQATTIADRLYGSSENADLQTRFQVLLEAQISDPDMSDDDEPREEVTLSTAHRAKGLEWSEVHVAGYSEGLMPLAPRDDTADPSSHRFEERRLSYVAITRAKKTCVLHHAAMLSFPGDHEPSEYEPSSFLAELGIDMPEPEPRSPRPTFHALR